MRYMIIALVALLTGCANDLYFGTYTRLGIDASEDGAGIGYKNGAVNIAPPKKDEKTFDVIGTSDVDLSFTDVILHEVLAVGDAAVCASMKDKASAPAALTRDIDAKLTGPDTNKPAVGPLIFGAHTSWSLIDFSWTDAASKGITFGYKRSVGVKIPIINDQVGSVYTEVSVNSSDHDINTKLKKSKLNGIRSTHVFATGNAAIIKAGGEAAKLNGGDTTYNGCLK